MIQGVDGFEAVRLWHRYRRGDRAALMKLALYNLTDVVNLVDLLEYVVRLKYQRLTLLGDMRLAESQVRLKYDSESLAEWIAQELTGGSSWARTASQ